MTSVSKEKEHEKQQHYLSLHGPSFWIHICFFHLLYFGFKFLLLLFVGRKSLFPKKVFISVAQMQSQTYTNGYIHTDTQTQTHAVMLINQKQNQQNEKKPPKL